MARHRRPRPGRAQPLPLGRALRSRLSGRATALGMTLGDQHRPARRLLARRGSTTSSCGRWTSSSRSRRSSSHSSPSRPSARSSGCSSSRSASRRCRARHAWHAVRRSRSSSGTSCAPPRRSGSRTGSCSPSCSRTSRARSSVETTLRLSFNVALIAGLSFLGFGLQPPAADWGLMINENQHGLTRQPWPVLLPVIAIALLTIGTSLVGDGLARAATGIERGQTGASEHDRPALEVDDLRVEIDRQRRRHRRRHLVRASPPGEVLGLVGRVRLGQDDRRARGARAHAARRSDRGGRASRSRAATSSSSSGRAARDCAASTSRTCPQDPGLGAEPGDPDRRSSSTRRLSAHGFGTSHDGAPRAPRRRCSTRCCFPTTTSFLRRYPHQLSGGQQQRVALAMAFACRAAGDRARRADDRPRRDDAGARARDRARRCAPRTASRRSTSATTSPSWPPSPTGSPSCTAAGSSSSADGARALPALRAPVHAPAGRGDPGDVRPTRARSGSRERRRGPGTARTAASSRLAAHTRRSSARSRVPAPSSRYPPSTWSAAIRTAKVLADARHERRLAVHAATRPDAEDALARNLVDVNASHGTAQVALRRRPRRAAARVPRARRRVRLGQDDAGALRRRPARELHRRDLLPRTATGARRTCARPRTRDAQIQYVFQSPYSSLNPRKTIAQIVEQPISLFFALGRAEARARVVARRSSGSRSARRARPLPTRALRAASGSGSRSRGRS